MKGVKAANLCGLLGTTVDRADLPILGDFSTVVNRVEYDSRPGRLPTRTGPYTTTMNWDDLRDCENNTGYDPTTVTSFGSEGQTTLMWSDRCNPSIEIPNNVYDIQSEWNTCSGWLVDGVPDPPVALHTAGVIKPPVDPSPTSNAPIQSPPAQPADPPPTIAPTPTPAPPAPDPVPAPAPAPKPATQTSNPPSANPPKPSTQPEKPGNTAAPADNPVKSSSAPAPSAPKPNTRKVLGQTAVVLPSNAGIVVGTHTLHAGAPAVTIHGTLVSAADNNVLVVDNKSRTTLAPADPTGVIVGGQLLTPGGPAVTVSGTVISLGSSALIIGSSTTSFVPTSSAGGKTSVGIGEVILSELGWIVTAVAPVTSGSVTSPTATKNVDDPTILTGSSVRIRTRWGHIASAWMSFGILWWALG